VIVKDNPLPRVVAYRCSFDLSDNNMGMTCFDTCLVSLCAYRVSENLVKLPEPLDAKAQKAVASPFFGVRDFAFATARA